MLKTIKSLSEYEQLYNEYVTEGHVRGYLNYFISKKNISAYINEEKIKYAVVDGTLFLFADQGNYYKMYFWRLTAKTKSLPDADKEICCDIYEQQNNNFTVNVLHQLFIENNYECKQKYEQVRLSYGNLHTISREWPAEGRFQRRLIYRSAAGTERTPEQAGHRLAGSQTIGFYRLAAGSGIRGHAQKPFGVAAENFLIFIIG